MTPDARLASLVGVEHPIVLGAFGGMSSVALTAAVSNGGGLGSFGLYGYDAPRIAATARELRAATDRPFALNVWLPIPGEVDPSPTDAELAEHVHALSPYFAELGVQPPERPDRFLPSVDEQLGAVLEARPAALSVVFGIPSAALLAQAHAAGIAVIATATSVEEAVALESAGVDAIVASGSEAGGHRVSFLRAAEDSLVGLMALLPQVVDAVDVPVIAAGGIADARGVRAASALGAAAVQVGTAFLATRESAAADSYRAAILAAGATDTVLTRGPSGRLARGIANRLTRELTTPAPFPIQNWLTGRFRSVAAEQDVADLMSLWAGQSAGLARGGSAADVLAELLRGVAR